MAFTRSTTGCLACKTRRKKCDETKPHCLRCQKLRTQCPGYTYVQNTDKPHGKLRTLPAPRTVIGQSRVTAREETHLTDAGTRRPNNAPHPEYDLICRAVYATSYTHLGANDGLSSGAVDRWNGGTSSSAFNGSLQPASINFNSHLSTTCITNTGPTQTPPGMSLVEPMTSGQASLLEALFSLGQPPTPNPASKRPRTIVEPSIRLVANGPPPRSERQDDHVAYGRGDPTGALGIVPRELVLDRMTDSNALPFVLQSYAAWVSRMAFEPVKLKDTVQDFVYSQFEDGEQARRVVFLLASLGSSIGSVEFVDGEQKSMLSALQIAIRRRLAAVKSRPRPTRDELAKALDSTMEVIVMQFYVSSIMDAIFLKHEAAPIFQRLCAKPPNTRIDLLSLLSHPLGCLRHYAHLDIMVSIFADIPTVFRYEVALPTNQPQSIAATQSDGVLQWLYGAPPRLLLVFAQMKLLRHDGLVPTMEAITSLERDIRELPPFSSSCSEPFLEVMRFTLQECWKQAAYIYLYMAVCGDPSNAPRVKKAVRRYMKLLEGVKPGHTPDEFLLVTFYLVPVAAQQKRDREVIRQRFLGRNTHGRTFHTSHPCLAIIDDYWARADSERRPVVWADVAISRKRVVGV